MVEYVKESFFLLHKVGQAVLPQEVHQDKVVSHDVKQHEHVHECPDGDVKRDNTVYEPYDVRYPVDGTNKNVNQKGYETQYNHSSVLWDTNT